MKIEAQDKTVQNIFSVGYYKIPRFQRPYSWGEDEVNSFWNDVVIENTDNYFIGSMVVYQDEGTTFGIVDGQQRLTTITLMLAAVRNALIKLDEESLARGVHQYIERPNIDNVNEFILTSETSFPYLQNRIQSFDGFKVSYDAGTEELNLKRAFDFINNALSELNPQIKLNESGQLDLFQSQEFQRKQAVDSLKEIRNKVLALKLVSIELDSEEDAYLIFETLNARGRDLTTSDLVKNLLLRKIKPKNVRLDEAKESWNRMVKQFDDAGIQSGMDPFLYHYWLSRHEYTTDKKLYPKLKAYSNSSQEADKLLNELQENSDYYLSTIVPENRKWKSEEKTVKASLDALNLFSVKQQAPMVLALMRAYRNKHITLRMLRQTLEKIESFHYGFNAITSQRSSGSISTHYSKFAIMLSNASSHAEIQQALNGMLEGLNNRIPSHNEFMGSFLDLTYMSRRTKSKSIVRYTLGRILGPISNGLPIDHGAVTIEHLLPESDQGTDNSIIGNIGNLILVDKTTNSIDLSAHSFPKKKKILLGLSYPLDDYIISQDVWGEKQISERSQWLADTIYYNFVNL